MWILGAIKTIAGMLKVKTQTRGELEEGMGVSDAGGIQLLRK